MLRIVYEDNYVIKGLQSLKYYNQLFDTMEKTYDGINYAEYDFDMNKKLEINKQIDDHLTNISCKFYEYYPESQNVYKIVSYLLWTRFLTLQTNIQEYDYKELVENCKFPMSTNFIINYIKLAIFYKKFVETSEDDEYYLFQSIFNKTE